MKLLKLRERLGHIGLLLMEHGDGFKVVNASVKTPVDKESDMNGYACRSRGCDKIIIGVGSKPPLLKKDTGWFWYAPGWFATLGTRTFKKKFGFGVAPGTVVKIKIGVSLS